MKRFLSVCLLLALISPVATLSCVNSIGTTASNEAGIEIKECPFEDPSCYSLFVDIPILGGDDVIVMKGCIPSVFCTAGDYAASVSKTFSIAGRIDCCQEDLCNKMSDPLEPRKKLPDNGLTCPSCASLFSDNCRGFFHTKCRGEEDQCFSIGGRSKHLGRVSARGCANKNICDQMEGFLDLNLHTFLGEITDFSCYPAEDDEDYYEDEIVQDTPSLHV